MPRDAAGNYGLPSGYLAVTGEIIAASQHNPPLEDIATALTGSLPRNGSAGMLANLAMGGKKITGLAPGTDPTDAVAKSQIDNFFPVGIIVDFAGSSATVPANWLLCYGQAVSRATYAALFACIGTTYGAGDSTTTFNLPDYRGRVAAGKDDMGGTSANRLTGQTGGVNGDNLAATGGTETHTLTTAQLAAHNHTGSTASAGSHSHTMPTATTTGGVTAISGQSSTGGTLTTSTDGAHTHTVTINDSGGGTAHNNVQPTIILNKIIRAS